MKTDLRSWLTDVEAHGELKTVDAELLDVAGVFFG